MIPDNHAKSSLSISYVKAVAAQAGYGCQFIDQDQDYGVDAQISEIQFTAENRYVNSGFHYNIQIKASHNFQKQSDKIVYALDADAYNRLIHHKEEAQLCSFYFAYLNIRMIG